MAEKEIEAENFDEHVEDLIGCLTAYQEGHLGQESILMLTEVAVMKMKLVCDRTVEAILACPEAALLEGHNES